MANKNTNPGIGKLADSRVMHKERYKEKGKSPYTPLKEKEIEKGTTGSVSGSRVRVRVGADTFFDPALDPVSVAVAVFGGNRDYRRLWRWYLYRIGEDAFRQLAFTQWRENRSDGIPNNPPACFQCKLTAANPKSCYLENIKITSADFHSSKGPSPEVPQITPPQPNMHYF